VLDREGQKVLEEQTVNRIKEVLLRELCKN